jgi:23S rRNA (guanosine2251-2'-O)-methyltransferase
MKKEIEKEKNSSFAEGSLSVLTVLLKQSRDVERVFYDENKKITSDRKIQRISSICRARGIPFERCTSDFIEENTTSSTHGGIVALVGERKTVPLEDLFKKTDGFLFLFDGVEDPYNFAYSVRSMYAAGADGMILSPRNWMSAAGVCIRGSAGTTEMLDCAVYETRERLIETAKKFGYRIVCADENTDTVHTDPVLKKPLLLIVGGEKRGISRELLDASDTLVKIDYAREFKMSLTASAAASILAFQVAHQNSKKG